MKICVNCTFFKREGIDMGGGQMGLAFVCKHEECADPVTGDPLPCNLSRQSPNFCGINARYYKETVEKTPQDKNVIEIAKA